MDTKKIVEDLKRCAKITRMEDCVGCSYQGTRFGCYHLIKIDAAKRLEKLEKKNAELKAENEARKLFCEAKDEINKDLYRS